MMSIGVLGFVVWSRMMAFPLSDLGVIFFTIGWNSSLLFIAIIALKETINLLNTFFSLDVNKVALSAGNLNLKESSETIRENTYNLFRSCYTNYYKKEFNGSSDWLSWFVGFSEGDGAFMVHKTRCIFVVTQKDKKVLLEIKEMLGIGVVRDFYNNQGAISYSRFIVSDNKGIFLLYTLFNGAIVNLARLNQIERWSNTLSKLPKLDIGLFGLTTFPQFIQATRSPSLNDAWLSGFTDAEGCFSVKIGNEKKNYYVTLSFILDQKDGKIVLDKIGEFLDNPNKKGVLRTPNKNRISTSNDMYRLSIYCNDKAKISLNRIIDYFETYPLKTTKSKSFSRWVEISNIIVDRQPLSPESLSLVRDLRHDMNKFTIENKPMGLSTKS